MRLSFTTSVLLASLLLVPIRPAIAQQTSGQEVLNNAAVLTMVRGGVSGDLIVRKIRNNPGNYSLSTNDLVRLKQQGVPDKVVNAMLEKSEGGAPAPDTASAPDTSPTPAAHEHVGLSGEWQPRQSKDPLSDVVSNSVVLALAGNPSGSFLVQASCRVESTPVVADALANVLGTQDQTAARPKTVDFPEVRLSIEPVPSHLHFKLSTYTTDATTRQTLSGNYETTPAVEKHCAQLGLRIGSGGVAYMQSDSCGDDRLATLTFSEDPATISAKTKKIMGVDGSNALVNMLMGMAGKMVANKVMPVSDLLRAESFRVELPLSTGASTVITIPESETFRKFANDCVPPAPQPSALSSYSGVRGTPPAPVAPHTSDGFVYGNSQANKSRVFTGNVDQFAAVLPSFIDRAGGLAIPDGPDRYRPEIAFIVQQLKTCMQITPEVAAGFRHVPNPRTHADLVILTGDYKPCSPGGIEGLNAYNITSQLRATSGAKKFDFNTERGISMDIRPIGALGQNDGYRVHIGFTQMIGDAGYDFSSPQTSYKIVDAVIKP